MNNTDALRFAVIGNPVAHSRSPIIHQQFAQQFGHHISYEKMEVNEDELESTIRDFFIKGGKGLSITLPYKFRAFEIAEHKTIFSQLAKASNTLWFSDGKIVGDNTDGMGLCNDLIKNRQFFIGNASILLLGAGGASMGCLAPILAQRPKKLIIVNRSIEKAEAMVQFGRRFAVDTELAYMGLPLTETTEPFDLIINATSASINGQVITIPPDFVNANTVVYDMMYGFSANAFLQQPNLKYSQTYDGLGMLIEQASLAYTQWMGVIPDTAPVIEFVRKQITF